MKGKRVGKRVSLLEAFIINDQVDNLVLVCAYRDNEVDGSHLFKVFFYFYLLLLFLAIKKKKKKKEYLIEKERNENREGVGKVDNLVLVCAYRDNEVDGSHLFKV